MQYSELSKMRVACIFPSVLRGDFNIPFGEPLGLLYIAGVANSLGCETKVFIPYPQENYALFIERILNFSPHILAFSIMTCHAYDAIRILADINKKNKTLLSIAGGPHPTLEPDFFLQRGFDICVIGQGEMPFYEILNKISTGYDIKGVNGTAYINDGKLVIKHQKLLSDLDSLPYPIRLPAILKGPITGSLAYPNPKIKAGASIITSRGCPYNCSYCCSPFLFERKVIWRSAEKVVEEMKYLQETYQVDFFRIDDVSFNIDHSFTIDLCERIIQSGLRFHWYCMCNARNLNSEVISAMKEAGCSLISVGVESMDADTLSKINRKSMNNEKIPEVLDIICKNGIATNIFYMIGFPWQSPEKILKETEALYQLNAHKIQVFIATPFPKTPFWYAIKDDLFPESYHLYDCEHLVYKHPFLSPQQAEELKRLIIRNFYLNCKYKKRVKAFLKDFPKYKDTFLFYWRSLPFYQELKEYLGNL